MEKKIITEEPNKVLNNEIINDDNNNDTNALSNNKVDVEIEPDVKSNNVYLQMCSCFIVLNCFKPDTNKSL
jgi:hypothetical protein